MKVTIVKGVTCLLIMLAVISTTVIIATDSKIEQNENLSKQSIVSVTTQLTTEVTSTKKVQKTTEEMREVTTEQVTEEMTEVTTVETTTNVKPTTIEFVETTKPKEIEAQITKSETCTAIYSALEFMNMGVIYWSDWRWTWYSEKVLPGGGLNIPGRYSDSSGYICDENDYICLAASSLDKGTIVSTPFGKSGKVYDTGCASDTLDVYVNW